jgi:hypothetical protein
MQCPDGLKRKCFPLLCMHVCDHKEALKTTNTKKTYCTACSAHEGQLHLPGCAFERKTGPEMQERYMRLRTGVLDANENILPDLKEEVRRREDEEMMGCR